MFVSRLGLLVAAGTQSPPLLSSASVAATANAPSETDTDPNDLLFDQSGDQIAAKQYREALATLKQIRLDPDNKTGRALVDVQSATALTALGKGAEATKLLDDAEALAPREPQVWRRLFSNGLVIDHTELSAVALDKLLARAPDVVREIDGRSMAEYLSRPPANQVVRNQDRKIEIARLGYGESNLSGGYIVQSAVYDLLSRGDVAGAIELSGHIYDPEIIMDMLVWRNFSPLWPSLERRAGPHLETVRQEAATRAEVWFAQGPVEPVRLKSYLEALRAAGRLDEVIANRSKLPQSAAAMATADEDMGWAVNEVALAYHAAGRKDEADALFAMLNEATSESDDWRISMKINRLELLVQDGNYAAALPLIEPAMKLPQSDYATQLLRRLRYCALSGLGRGNEAANLLPDLLAHAKDAYAPTIDGLLCAGQVDRAEAVTLEALKDSKFAGDFVAQMQRVPLSSDDASVWTRRWTELRQRPVIAQAFAKLARDLPSEFVPEQEAQKPSTVN